ncbi:MAG TPA: MarP family serine protease [Candidatus Saccharimonadales bacterium]|nr:MarP family serine protease [Candidatus Saccharimonadales bacterium]
MLIDIIIVLIVIAGAIRNWRSGFVHQFCATIGFFGGLLVGRVLEKYTIELAHTPISRAFVTILTIFGLALIGLSIGEYAGLRLKHRSLRSKYNTIDNTLGVVLTAVTILLSIWLIASVISGLPATRLKGDIQKSHIIAAMNKALPSAPRVISDLGKLIDPNGFPDVFIGSEPIPRGNVNLPALGDLQTAVNADKDSVVRIEGLGCGGLVAGSGFVVGNGLVATNAHVVAGISTPYVEDVNGRHVGKVVYFDPNLDFAVLRVSGLAGSALKIDLNQINPGTPGAVLGYPGGGGFSAGPAAVLAEFNATGHNIYGSGATLRQVYEIQADVIPGNSGGPLVSESGRVMGVVFAQSTSYAHVGYSLAMQKVHSEILQARNSYQGVSTGQCAE